MTYRYLLHLLWFLGSNIINSESQHTQTIVVTATSKKINGLYQTEAYCMVKIPFTLQSRQLHIDLTLEQNTSYINIINKDFFSEEKKGNRYYIQNLVPLQSKTEHRVAFSIEHTSQNLLGYCFGWVSAVVEELTTAFTDVATTTQKTSTDVVTTTRETSTIAKVLRQTSPSLTMEITKTNSSTGSTHFTSYSNKESTDLSTSVSTNVQNTESHSFTSSTSVTTVPSISQDEAPSSTSISHGSHFSESNTVDHSSSTLRFETVPAVSTISEKTFSVQHSMKDTSSTVHNSTDGDTSDLATISNKYSTDKAVKTDSTENTKGTQTTCVCACSTKLTKEELLQRKRQLVAELKIDKHVTKAALRRKQCADDDRKSSKTIGICGIIVLGLVAGIIVAFDLSNVLSAWTSMKTPIYV